MSKQDGQKMLKSLKKEFKADKGMWPFHYVVNSQGFVEAISDLKNLPGYEKLGTTGLSPEQIFQALGSSIFGYEQAVGQASSDPKFRDYATQLAMGKGALFVQALARQGKTTVSKLMNEWKREGMHSLVAGYATSKATELEELLAQAAVAQAIPSYDKESLDALVKAMKKEDKDVSDLTDVSLGEYPGYLTRYGLKKWRD